MEEGIEFIYFWNNFFFFLTWIDWVSYRMLWARVKRDRKDRAPRRTKKSRAPWQRWARGAGAPGTVRAPGQTYRPRQPRMIRMEVWLRSVAIRIVYRWLDTGRNLRVPDLQGGYLRIRQPLRPIQVSSILYRRGPSIRKNRKEEQKIN